MTNIQCTSITIGAFISSNNEMISKQKLDMPESNKGSNSSLRGITQTGICSGGAVRVLTAKLDGASL